MINKSTQAQLTRSRLLHPQNPKTTHLYNPLRQALLQSIQPTHLKCPQQKCQRSSSMFDIKYSQVSNKIRELSPAQAAHLIQQIYVTNLDLVPTGNLGTVTGKGYVAIRGWSREKAVISQQELRNRLATNGRKVQRTVYQVQPTPENNSLNNSMTPISFQARSNNNRSQSLYYSTKTVERSMNDSNRKVSQFTQSSLKKEEKIGADNQYGLADIAVQHQKKEYLRTQPSNNNIESQALLNSKSQKSISSYHSGKGQPLTKQSQLTNLSRFTIAQSLNQPPNSPPLPTPPLSVSCPNTTTLTTQTDSKHTRKRSRKLQIVSKQGRSKYNLFSALDYAVNSGCGGCGSVEIVASKEEYQWK